MTDVILFDLDGTLYPIENGYEDAVRENIFEFMHIKLGVPREKAHAIWYPLFKEYNQSLKGLRAGGYQFETEEYWDFIRAGRENYLKPDPKVNGLLESLHQEKWVVTNCSEKHAVLALQTLGLEGYFKGVLGAEFFGDACKPDPSVFAKVLQHIDVQPSRVAMFEDSVKNLRQAKALGLTTILVAGETAKEEGFSSVEAFVDGTIASCCEEEVRRAVPQLWL